MKNYFKFLVLLLLLSGCASLKIDPAISRYQTIAPKVNLGDSKEQVLSLLLPTQEGVPGSAKKQPESFLKDGNTIEIYYFRSMRQPDGITTDDEFTPYVFTNGKLTSIGWTSLGGPQTHGQVIQPPTQINQTTVVH